jgi:CoA:oxalate CoA-transferase
MSNKPLDGILVVDFTQAFSGPFCAMMLSDNGARVIKIERPGSGDMLRDAGPFDDKHDSLYFASGNRGKESVEFNLGNEEDKKVIFNIIKKADILLENFRPGVMEKLGYGYEAVKAVNPNIIYTSISGFGQTGPRKHEPGFDMIAQGYSGLMSVNGQEHGEPTRVGVSMGDMTGSVFAYMSTMTALYARAVNGKGTHVDISMVDGLFALMQPCVPNYLQMGKVDGPEGNSHPAVSPFGMIPTKDGHVIVAVLGAKLWKSFCQAIERPEIESEVDFDSNEHRLQNREALRQIVRPIFKTKSTEEWLDVLQKGGIPCAKVNTIKDACEFDQIIARNMICQAGDYKLAGNPMKFSEYEDESVKKPVPTLGEHTDTIKKEFA